MKKSRTAFSLFLATLFALDCSVGFARNGRVAKRESTVGAEVESCRQNPPGTQILAQHALNAASNPLADRVSSMEWDKFCGCFGPKHFEVSKVVKEEQSANVSGSYEKYEKQRDAIAVMCAAEGVPKEGATLPAIASHPSGNLARNHAKLEGVTAHCVGFLRSTISLDTPLGHTAPSIEGGVHGEIEGRARSVFLAQEDGRGAAPVAG